MAVTGDRVCCVLSPQPQTLVRTMPVGMGSVGRLQRRPEQALCTAFHGSLVPPAGRARFHQAASRFSDPPYSQQQSHLLGFCRGF